MIPGALNPMLLGGGDAGYQIQRSLRLRKGATPYASKTPASSGSQTTWTISKWVKRGELAATAYITFWGGTGATNTFNIMGFGYGGSTDTFGWRQVTPVGGIAGEIQTNRVFRDPSVWLHLVIAWDTNNATAADRMRLYVNGVRETSFATSTNPSLGLTSYLNTPSYSTLIGAGNNGGVGQHLDGYLSEVNFIDGQALTPSSFGQIDPVTGQWTAKKYTGTYGTNGFYLPFDDPTSATTLGYDRGNSAQHVTIRNQAGADQTIQAGIGACRLATISTSNTSGPASANEYLTIGLGTAVPVTSSLKIYMDAGPYSWADGRNLYINGTQVASGNVSIATVSGMQEWTINFAGHGVSSLSSFTLPQKSSGRAFFYGVSVDGSTVLSTANDWLLNNISTTAGATYDSMLDVPLGGGGAERGNYCTLNPLDGGASVALSDGNLGIVTSTSAASAIGGTFWMSTGKWYWDFAFTSKTGDSSATGWWGIRGVSTTTNYTYSGDGLKYKDSVNQGAYGATYAANDVIGFAFDADAGTLTCYKNGVAQGTAFTGITGSWTPYFADTSSSSGLVGWANFGQRPFAYTPPTGFKALHTGNLTSTTVVTSGAFTGNVSADGPAIWCNGTPETLTINGNAVTWGTHADRTAGGFKLRTSSASYNSSGSNTWTATYLSPSTKSAFKYQLAKGNP